MLDFLLVIVFLSSAFAFWYLISIRIPELVAIPDEVIGARLEDQSAKVRLFLLHFKTWFREKRYKILLLNVAGKALYRLHILLLKIDNALAALLKKIRESGVALNPAPSGKGGVNGNGQNGRSDYWKKLHSEEAAAPNRPNRIREVRERR